MLEQSQMKRSYRIGSAVCACVAVVLILMQIAYFIYNKKSSYEYIADWMLYAVNAMILLSLFLMFFFLRRRDRSVFLAASIVFSLLFCVNAVLMFLFGFKTTSVVSLSSDLKHLTVLKQNIETGKVTVYRNPILVFARLHEPLPHSVDSQLKTQWLAPDVCAVTYEDTSGKLHQYVSTYGDRGNGLSYYTVAGAISGNWALDAKNADGNTIKTDENGITIRQGDHKELFAYTDCVQFGTLALVLYRNDIPVWTVALNGDCNLIEGYNILDDDGTITLCQVSMEKTAPFQYFRTYNPLAGIELPERQSSDAASPEPKESLSSDFSELVQYDQYGIMIIETNSTDIFEIAKRTLAEDHKRTGAAYNDADLQIMRMTLLAGDLSEFVIELEASGKNILGDLQYHNIYRIKQGANGYGAAKANHGDIMEGLKVIDPLQVKDTSGDISYRLYIPRVRFLLTEQEQQDLEQQELASAKILADTLLKYPDLAGFQSQQGLVKVKTEAIDPYMVARLVLEEDLKMFAINGFDNDVQIDGMFLLAGDESEFLIKINYSTLFSCENSTGTATFIPEYRIKKGNGVYIAMESGYEKVGAAGLKQYEFPPYNDTSNNPAYHFFVPAA